MEEVGVIVVLEVVGGEVSVAAVLGGWFAGVFQELVAGGLWYGVGVEVGLVGVEMGSVEVVVVVVDVVVGALCACRLALYSWWICWRRDFGLRG